MLRLVAEAPHEAEQQLFLVEAAVQNGQRREPVLEVAVGRLRPQHHAQGGPLEPAETGLRLHEHGHDALRAALTLDHGPACAVDRVEDLSIGEASSLIDELKDTGNGAGGQR